MKTEQMTIKCLVKPIYITPTGTMRYGSVKSVAEHPFDFISRFGASDRRKIRKALVAAGRVSTMLKTIPGRNGYGEGR